MHENDYKILNDFLEHWTLERIKSLTLTEYALGAKNFKETFSYWVEEVTDSLGDIGGIGGGGSFKHGIYSMKDKKTFTGNKKDDGIYAWWSKYGENAEQAFQCIKKILLDVINYSIANEWKQIDKIDFYNPVKWKWAFLYSKNALFPVYKLEALKISAINLGYKSNDYSYPTLYNYLISQKKENEENFDLSVRVWNIYLNNKSCNYYILGSKYGSRDVFPEMLAQNVISTGFASGFNLAAFVGKSEKEVVKFLEEKGEEPKSYNCLKYFLNIKPGDKIAVKADGKPKGSFAFLSIIGIAEAIENEDDFYSYDPDDLGHTVTVKWLYAPVYKEFGIGGYGQTIHKLTDQNTINEIFNTDYMTIQSSNINYSQVMEVSDLLKYKQQIILQGPPGTGKTYMAKDIAYYLIFNKMIASSGEERSSQLEELNRSCQFKMVQFHPAYSYEDFVRGISARTVDGQVEYKTENKILAQFAKDAHKNFIDVKKDDQILSKEKWIKKKFLEYKIDLDERFKDGKIFLNDSGAYIKRINDESFTYYHNSYHETMTCGFDISFEKFLELFSEISDNTDFNSSQLYYRTNHKKVIDNLIKDFQKFIGVIPPFKETGDVLQLKNYILIIDEINRANLSAVLGELIYSLEYRGEPVNSIYDIDGDRELLLPPNLFIIGTMNTADRSVGHIDLAIRRRFAYFDILPSRSIIEKNSVLPALELFDNVTKLFCSNYVDATFNQNRSDFISPDFNPMDVMIGHSYFLAKNDAELKLKLKYEIKPILLEYVRDGILIGEDVLTKIESL